MANKTASDGWKWDRDEYGAPTHPGDIMDCKCITGEQHGKMRELALAAWDRWYGLLQNALPAIEPKGKNA